LAGLVGTRNADRLPRFFTRLLCFYSSNYYSRIFGASGVCVMTLPDESAASRRIEARPLRFRSCSAIITSHQRDPGAGSRARELTFVHELGTILAKETFSCIHSTYH
jgi:hypothetical protein